MTDIVIIGAGCAGMTAAIYAARAGRSVRLLECEAIGGQIASSPKVENYPAFSEISGMEFSDRLYQQAEALGVQFDFARAESVETGDGFTVVTDSQRLPCRAVILATGTKHRKLNIDGEERLKGRGVSYCAVCDGAFFRGAETAVVGGGSAALQSAEYLSGLCRKVTLIHRRETFRGEEQLARRVKARRNIELCLGCVPVRLCGEERMTGLIVRETAGGQEKEISASGLFIAIGQEPQNERFRGLVRLDEAGYIDAGEDCRTSVPGIFAAGDCRRKTVRQLTTAAADGSVAALAACDFVAGREE